MERTSGADNMRSANPFCALPGWEGDSLEGVLTSIVYFPLLGKTSHPTLMQQ